jgi:hypothetical protein
MRTRNRHFAERMGSQMIEYSFLLYHGGQRSMLYNGDGFAKDGLGPALLTDG